MSSLHKVPPAFAAAARVRRDDYERLYRESLADPQAFWGRQAARIDWIRPPTRVKDTSFALEDFHIRWYDDGQLNVSVNCLDRHLEKRGDKTAIIFEGDDPKNSQKLTYRELHARVCRAANALKSLGVRKGERVTIYMPMIPDAAVAMLACSRIGAIHSVVFGGFSPDSLAGRIADCGSTVVITADEGVRGGKRIPLKANVDQALSRPETNTVRHVLVLRHVGARLDRQPRDQDWDELLAAQSEACPPETMDAEDPLFILYTSGSTGRPKGVLHTTGGYLVFASLTHETVFDLREDDVYWCTADVGWVTGHSYVVYGPLANGATTLMFEGVPNYPDVSRFWRVVDKHAVSLFYTAPTAIRALMRDGEAPVKATSRSTLRLLGTVGEPINPEAWEWYHRVVGDGRCPVVDTWWQTETGGIMITPLPGAVDQKPGSATLPFFGVQPAIVDGEGRELEGACEGNLVIKDSWPGQMRTVYGDHQRFIDTYFKTYPGTLRHGRRGAARCRRLLLDHRARRRRAQRRRAPDRDRRGRERAGRASEGGGGRGGRLPARGQGAGHLRVRHARGGCGAERGAAQGAHRLGTSRDRADRDPRFRPVGAGAAEDPVREDHAPHPAQDCGARARSARGRVDACRSIGGRAARARHDGEAVRGVARHVPLLRRQQGRPYRVRGVRETAAVAPGGSYRAGLPHGLRRDRHRP